MKNTKIIAGVVLQKENKYLLVQEKQSHVYGLWNLPAGHVDRQESIEKAAIREAEEETGYIVKLEQKIATFQKSDSTKYAFLGTIIGGKLRYPPEEILNAQWFSFEEIKKMNRQKQLRGNWVIKTITILQENK